MKKLLYLIAFIAFSFVANAQGQLGKLQQYFLTPEELSAFQKVDGETNDDYIQRMKKQNAITKFFQCVNPSDYPSEEFFSFSDNNLYHIYRDKYTGGFYTIKKIELQKLQNDLYVIKNDKLKQRVTYLETDIVIFNNYSIIFATINKNYSDKAALASGSNKIYMAGSNQRYAKGAGRVWENNDWGEEWTKIYGPDGGKGVDIYPFLDKCWEETWALQQKNINDFVKNYSAKISSDFAKENDERGKRIDAEIAAKKDAEAKRIAERDVKIKAFLQKYPEASLTMSENFTKWSAKGKPRLTHFIGTAGFIPNRNLNAGLKDKMFPNPDFKRVDLKDINGAMTPIYKFDGEGPEAVIKLLKSPKTGRNFITFETDMYDYYQDHFGYSKSYYYSPCAGSDCEVKAKNVNLMEDGMFWYKGNLIVYYDVNNSQDAILVYSYPGAEPIPENMLQYKNESVFWNTYITQGLRHLQDAALIKK